MSYVGVALNKTYSVRWIAHIKDVLWKCCIYLEVLKPELPSNLKHIVVLLHTLVAFTSIKTWVLLNGKGLEVLKPGMNQLCSNILGDLFHKGFYITLKVRCKVLMEANG